MSILSINPLGQLEDLISTAGAITFGAGVLVDAGRGAMHAGPAGAGTAAALLGGWAANGTTANLALADGYGTWKFRIDTLPTTANEIILRVVTGASTRKMDLCVRSDGKLELYDAGGTLVATGTTVLSTGVWYRLGIRGGNGAAAPYAVYVAPNGQPFSGAELSGTCNQGANALDRFQPGKAANKNTQTMSMYYQDFVVDDAQVWDHYKIGIALPRANGAGTDFTGDYTDCDEYSNDGATTEITSGTNGHVETYLMTSGSDLGIGAADIIRAVSGVNIRMGGASNEAAAIRFISGASITHTSNANLTAAYAMGQFLKLLDPNTGAAWTRDAFDAIEVGCRLQSSFQMWVTSVMAYVMWTPVTTAPQFRGSYE